MVSANRLASEFNIKKIAAEPKLLRAWLVSQAVRIESLAVDHPDTQSVVMKFADELVELQSAIGDSPGEIQLLVEGKARRAAKKLGFVISKSKAALGEKNRGLFKLCTNEGRILGGRKFDLSAQDVIAVCRRLQKQLKLGAVKSGDDLSKRAFEELYNHDFPSRVPFRVIDEYADLDMRNPVDQLKAQERFSQRRRESEYRLLEESQYIRVSTFGDSLPECLD